MNVKEFKYELHLSALEELQTEKNYCYCLSECGAENQYCISISEWEHKTMRQECKNNFVADSAKAHNVVQWLYQNAVAPAHLHDVLRDLNVQGQIAMQK